MFVCNNVGSMKETKIFKPDNRHLVVTSGDLTDVLIGERLSLLSCKILCSAIATIKPKQSKFEAINFNVKQLAELLGVHKHNNYHAEIKEAGDQLLFYVGVVDEEKKMTHSVPLVQDYRYERGTLSIEFNDAASSYLLDLTGNRRCIFSSYHLSDVNNLKHANMIRFFWYAIRKCRNHPRQFIMPVVEYFEFMQLSKSHLEFSHLNRRSLKPLLKELNEKTHLSIDCIEKRKVGQKVTELVFKVSYIMDKQKAFAFSPAAKNKPRSNLEVAIGAIMKAINVTASSAGFLIQRDITGQQHVDDSKLVDYVHANIRHAVYESKGRSEAEVKRQVIEALKQNKAKHETDGDISLEDIEQSIKEKQALVERLKTQELAQRTINYFLTLPKAQRDDLFKTFVELVNDGVLKVAISHVLKSVDILLNSQDDKVFFSEYLDVELGNAIPSFEQTNTDVIEYARERGIELPGIFDDIAKLRKLRKSLIAEVA